MKKQFYNQVAACQYIMDNDLPMIALCKGRNGMSAVNIDSCGGVVTAPSSDNIKSQGRRRYTEIDLPLM